MIFSNDRSIYVESNGKKLDDGIKESESEWKMVISQGLYIHEGGLKGVKRFKLLIMYCMICVDAPFCPGYCVYLFRRVFESFYV